MIKSSRWLLSRNRMSLNAGQAVRLDELLQANQALLTVYLLRDELKRLWFQRSPERTYQAWRQWVQQPHESGIQALQRFARLLEP